MNTYYLHVLCILVACKLHTICICLVYYLHRVCVPFPCMLYVRAAATMTARFMTYLAQVGVVPVQGPEYTGPRTDRKSFVVAPVIR